MTEVDDLFEKICQIRLQELNNGVNFATDLGVKF